MQKKSFYLLFFVLFFQKISLASQQKCYLINDKLEIIDSTNITDVNYFFDLKHNHENNKRPNPLLNLFKLKKKKNKRITAAILAFPFPFGIVGLHRIYLGTAPYVPVVYIASLGGVLGVLPFIDFCVLILDKDETRYLDNKKVFMWVD